MGVWEGLESVRKHLVCTQSEMNAFVHLLFVNFFQKCKTTKGGYVPRGQSNPECSKHNILEV